MYNEDFAARLTQLRLQKGVSARDMSLSLGQNPGYINNIENGKALPSMALFFYICEYFNIEPKDFFDDSAKDPKEFSDVINNLKLLNSEQFSSIAFIIKALAKS